jgi:asparagine synthetase B (glutamine-hydrolysing)
MAFYFAARGEGYEVYPNGDRRTYITPAKVFFSGLGADEQLGYKDPYSFLAYLQWVLSTCSSMEKIKWGLERNNR